MQVLFWYLSLLLELLPGCRLSFSLDAGTRQEHSVGSAELDFCTPCFTRRSSTSNADILYGFTNARLSWADNKTDNVCSIRHLHINNTLGLAFAK